MTRSDFEMPPLDEDLERLLRCERERPALSSARVERMWQEITADLALLPVGGSSQAHLPKPAVGPGSLVAAPIPISTSALPWFRHIALLLKARLPWMAITFGLGSSGGLLAGRQLAEVHLHRKVSATGDKSPVVAESRTQSPQQTAPAASPETVMALGVGGMSVVAAERHRPAPGGGARIALGGEKEMLEQAEGALRRGDWSTVLRETAAYTERFPSGEMAEENAYLAIRACWQGGDDAGARSRLQEFRRRFPHSPLGVRFDK